MGSLDGRVAVITGAGRGIGREHALFFAAEGAKVVVNDLGGANDGVGSDATPAEDVAAEIRAAGGEAVANADDVCDWHGAERLVNAAIDHFGDLDVLVNNAGILRDRVIANMTEEEWDAVVATHLKGTFAPSRWAAAYWRERHKAAETNDARIINTTSVSGLYGNPGQINYGAAKAGIAAFTQIAAEELRRYGVTCNAMLRDYDVAWIVGPVFPHEGHHPGCGFLQAHFPFSCSLHASRHDAAWRRRKQSIFPFE